MAKGVILEDKITGGQILPVTSSDLVFDPVNNKTQKELNDELFKEKAVLVKDNSLEVRSISKKYNTETLALADKNPIDTTTSLPLTVGQFVSIVADTTTSKNGIYRIGSFLVDGTMSLELQGKLGDLSSYALKGGSTKTLKEVEDSIKDISILGTPLAKFNFLKVAKTASFTYSDATFGNLGSNFTATMLYEGGINIFANPILISKGNPLTDGWCIERQNTGDKNAVLKIKGIEHPLFLSLRLRGANFITIISSPTEIMVLLNGVKILKIPSVATTSGEPLKLAANDDSWETTEIGYVSLAKRTLPNIDITNEIEYISSEMLTSLLRREFIGSPENMALRGWEHDGKSFLSTFDNTIVEKDLSEISSANYNRMNSVLMPNSFIFDGQNDLINNDVRKVSLNQPVYISKKIKVKGQKQITVHNAWGNRINSLYIIRDKDGNVLKSGKTGTQTAIDSIEPLPVVIDIPDYAYTFQANLRFESYIKKSELTYPNEYIKPSVFGNRDLGISAIMPSYFYCSDIVYYVDKIDDPNPIPILSQTAKTITMASGSGAGFVKLRGYNVFAKMADDSYLTLFVSRNGENDVLTIHNLELTATVVSIRGATRDGGEQIHLSDPACIKIGEGIVESTQNANHYKRLRYFGFFPDDFETTFPNKYGDIGYINDENGEGAFTYTSDTSLIQNTHTPKVHQRLSTKSSIRGGVEFNFVADVGANICTLKTKSPFKKGRLEVMATAPSQSELPTVEFSIPIIMKVYNNDVLVHTEKLNGYKIQRMIINNDNWGNVKIHFTCEESGQAVLFLYQAVMFETSKHLAVTPITSDSVVAYLGDSWQLMSEHDDVRTYPPMYRNKEGVESEWKGSAFIPRTVMDKTGCVMDLWGEGTKDGKWALEEQIFNLIHKKKYTHCIVEYWWNDLSKLGDKWIGYFALLCRILIANGIRPVVFCPSLIQYDRGRILAEKHILD